MLLVDVAWCLLVALLLTLVAGVFSEGGAGAWANLLVVCSILSVSIGLAVANGRRLIARWTPPEWGDAARLVATIATTVAAVMVGVEVAMLGLDRPPTTATRSMPSRPPPSTTC